MANPFVWFDLRTGDRAAARGFYERLLGWEINEVPMGDAALDMIGGAAPWGAIWAQPLADGHVQWLPYVQVADVDAAAAQAVQLGGKVLAPKIDGGPGWYTTVTDPTGAAVALWQAKPAS